MSTHIAVSGCTIEAINSASTHVESYDACYEACHSYSDDCVAFTYFENEEGWAENCFMRDLRADWHVKAWEGATTWAAESFLCDCPGQSCVGTTKTCNAPE